MDLTHVLLRVLFGFQFTQLEFWQCCVSQLIFFFVFLVLLLASFGANVGAEAIFLRNVFWILGFAGVPSCEMSYLRSVSVAIN